MFHNADNLVPGGLGLVEAEVPPYGVLSRPVLTRKDIIDDCDHLRTEAILIVKCATQQNGNAHGLEVVRRYQPDASMRAGIIGRYRLSFNDKAREAAVAAEGNRIDQGGRVYTWYCAQALFQGREECGLLLVLVIDRLGQGKARGKDIARIEARFNALQRLQAAQK